MIFRKYLFTPPAIKQKVCLSFLSKLRSLLLCWKYRTGLHHPSYFNAKPCLLPLNAVCVHLITLQTKFYLQKYTEHNKNMPYHTFRTAHFLDGAWNSNNVGIRFSEHARFHVVGFHPHPLTRVHGILFLRLNISIYHFILALSQHRLSSFYVLCIMIGLSGTHRDTVTIAEDSLCNHLLTFLGKQFSSSQPLRTEVAFIFVSHRLCQNVEKGFHSIWFVNFLASFLFWITEIRYFAHFESLLSRKKFKLASGKKHLPN